MQRLLIRADADARIGVGHVMRCRALAHAWQASGGTCSFAVAAPAPWLRDRLTGEGMGVETITAAPGTMADAAQSAELAASLSAGRVVVDGYHLRGEFQKGLVDAGLRVLALDDEGYAEPCHAHLLLNQNLHAAAALYPRRAGHTRLLLGTRFALLRREFLSYRDGKRGEYPQIARKVLVTLGGYDPDNVTLKVIEALQLIELAELEAVVLLGSNNPHRAQLKAAAENCRVPTRVLDEVPNMPELMAWADVAITAGGSTTWERAFMGLPGIMIVLAENQRKVAEACAEAGIGINLGPHQGVSVTMVAEELHNLCRAACTRATMGETGRALVDGAGGERVCMFLGDRKVRMRRAREADAHLLFEWANNPVVRASAFCSNPIAFPDHLSWLRRKLADPLCQMLLAVNEYDEAVGQIRFDKVAEGEAEVDVSVAPSQRGAGLGAAVIREGVARVFADNWVRCIHAYIKPDNQASLRAFERSGFQVMGQECIKGHVAVHAVRVNADGP